MNRVQRIELVGGLVLSAIAVTVFTVLLFLTAMAGEGPFTRDRLWEAVVTGAVLALPWVCASWVLWRAWWKRTGSDLYALDGPARLLKAAVATLPEDRRDWGVAMVSELAQVQGTRARWGFAAGSTQVAIIPPGRGAAAFVAAGLAVVAMAAGWMATGYALPGMRVFAVTFVALVSALATLAVARAQRVRRAGPGAAIAVTAYAGVAGCIAMIAYYLIAFPSATAALTPATAVVFAVVLAGCVWLVLTPPRSLIASGHAQAFGVGTAMVLGVATVIFSRLGLRGAFGMDQGLLSWLLLGPLVVAVASAAAAWTSCGPWVMRRGSGLALHAFAFAWLPDGDLQLAVLDHNR